MTTAEIEQIEKLASLKFSAAKQIRQLLDKVREVYGHEEAEADDLETEIIELVTG